MTHLVIGSGLLGQAIIDALLARDIPVRVLDKTPYENPATHNIVGDIRQPDVVRSACKDIDTVYHTAAYVSQTLDKPALMYDVNVGGTGNVIDACREHGVRHLVYTSSIDVVFDGSPISNGNETLAYPSRHLDYYGETKSIAEQRILLANDNDLRTIALRVGGLYGPNDRQRFPPIIALASQGSFVRLGNGSAKFNHVYVGNAAYAHLLAADALRAEGSPAQGNAYFITDHEATNFFDFIEDFLIKLGLSLKVRRVPRMVAQLVAESYVLRSRLLPLRAFAAPLLTPYVVAATCNDFWFTHRRAAQDFGYHPIITWEDAEMQTLTWIRDVLLPRHQETVNQ